MTAGGSRRRTWTLWGGLVFLALFGCALLFLPTLVTHRIGKYEARAVGHLLSVAEVTARDERGRAAKYIATASPSEPGKTGTRYFSIDETGTLHYEMMPPLDVQSPVLRR
jgi:hypothetical protein